MKLAIAVAGLMAAAAVLGYTGYVVVAWYRYGRRDPRPASDPLLDRFLARYEVRECHARCVSAPPALTLAAAKQMSLLRAPIARALFGLRSIPARLYGTPAKATNDCGIVEETLALGWGVLAEVPDREIVMGAVTQPWKADVVFRALPPEEFPVFAEPGYVKIAWTLSVEPTGACTCLLRTETRVVATDSMSRARFRRYWAFLSPGILLIRYEMLRLVAAEARRRHRSTGVEAP